MRQLGMVPVPPRAVDAWGEPRIIGKGAFTFRQKIKTRMRAASEPL